MTHTHEELNRELPGAHWARYREQLRGAIQPSDQLMKPAAICKLLQISDASLKKLVSEKAIPAYKVGKRTRFSLPEVMEALQIKQETTHDRIAGD